MVLIAMDSEDYAYITIKLNKLRIQIDWLGKELKETLKLIRLIHDTKDNETRSIQIRNVYTKVENLEGRFKQVSKIMKELDNFTKKVKTWKTNRVIR